MSQYEIIDDAGDEELQPLRRLSARSSRSVFNQFDKDGSGFIDASELQELCRALGAELTPGQ